MTLLIPAKVLLHVWSYDFYDMTLSTGKQRRHMINTIMLNFWRRVYCRYYWIDIASIDVYQGPKLKVRKNVY